MRNFIAGLDNGKERMKQRENIRLATVKERNLFSAGPGQSRHNRRNVPGLLYFSSFHKQFFIFLNYKTIKQYNKTI